jgi:mRNA-degrading endonuclease RelE of RelBE toxin-antitoxin system
MEERTLLATNRFRKDIGDLPGGVYDRINKAIKRLRSDPLPDALDIKKLKGRKQTTFRARVGDYRFTYSFDTDHIFLRQVDHRKYIYR